MWAKVFEKTGFTGGPLSGATLQIWEQSGSYKLTVLNDGNGNNGDYFENTTLVDTVTDDQYVKFDLIDECEFTYHKPKASKSIIYVTPTGVAIVT